MFITAFEKVARLPHLTCNFLNFTLPLLGGRRTHHTGQPQNVERMQNEKRRCSWIIVFLEFTSRFSGYIVFEAFSTFTVDFPNVIFPFLFSFNSKLKTRAQLTKINRNLILECFSEIQFMSFDKFYLLCKIWPT